MSSKIDIDVLNKYNLIEICNWKNLQNVAIEHHYSIDNSLLITYSNIRKIKRAVGKILTDIKVSSSSSSQFIGISSDIPIFCIPTLILGIISSGHAFVYLTKESQNLLLKDTNLNIEYIIARKHSCRTVGNRIIKRFIMHKQSLILLKVSKKRLENQHQINLHNSNDTNCFAYAVTTSGSTGLPSIVRVTHASIVSNILDLKRIFILTNSDKIVHLTPLTFDPSIIEIFLSISSGATLLTVSNKLKNNPTDLLTVLDKNRATFLSTTPSILLHRWSVNNLNLTLLGKNSELRVLLLGGESFPSPQTILKMKHAENRTRLFNIYGITEVSCWASINEICSRDENEMIMKYNNLGTVLSDTTFQVRSNNGINIISEGEGLLYIGSDTRICAINNENIYNLSSPVFRNTGDLVTIDCNGEIKLNGRQDSCVKRFGEKIYLNNLECHLKKLNFIKDSHAIFIENSSTIHLFFTAIYNKKELSNDEEIKIINEMWDHVRKLPTIMRPDYIHYLEQFKITKHGKICNSTLNKLSTNRTYNSDIGIFFESIWKSQLPITNDNNLSRFVDAGGTSIMALEIFGKLTDNIRNDFPELVGMLLENKTLSECQNYVVNQHNKTYLSSAESVCHYRYNDTELTSISCQFRNDDGICHWQKCRGKIIDFHSITSSETLEITTSNTHPTNNSSGSIKFLHLYDLTKCVDASPTVFKYFPNDEIFVSVGSHSGTICTVQISSNCSWKVQLPDRIEASILIIDNFKGIVGCHDGFIYCIHLKTGEIQWKFQTGNIVKCLTVMCSRRQNIIVGSYDRFVYCISIKSGSLVWKQFMASTCATPLIHDDTNAVIFASLDGNCISLDQITGEFRWKHRSASPIFSSPTFINNNRIVIVADVNGNIAALETDSGRELWEIKISEHIFSDLATIFHNVHNQLDGIVIATKSGNIYRYDFDKVDYKYPKMTYKISCESPIFASPWIDKISIVIAQENGELRTFDLNSGALCAVFQLGGKCFSSPVVHQNLIFIGCRDNNLYILTRQ